MFWKSIVYTFVCLNLGHLIKVNAQTFPIVRLNFYLKHVLICESYIHTIIFITSQDFVSGAINIYTKYLNILLAAN